MLFLYIRVYNAKKNMKTITKYYRIDHRETFFLKFILEAYDGIAVMTTINKNTGLVSIHVSPGCEKDVNMVLEELKKDIMIEHISDNKLL